MGTASKHSKSLACCRGWQVVGNWVEAIFILLELLPKHPSIPSLRALSRARHGFGLREIGHMEVTCADSPRWLPECSAGHDDESNAGAAAR